MGFQSEINKTIALGGAAAGVLKKVATASPEGEIEEPKKMEKPQEPDTPKKEYTKPTLREGEKFNLKNQVYLGPEPADVNALKDKLLLKQIEQQRAMKERMAKLREKKAQKNVLIKIN